MTTRLSMSGVKPPAIADKFPLPQSMRVCVSEVLTDGGEDFLLAIDHATGEVYRLTADGLGAAPDDFDAFLDLGATLLRLRLSRGWTIGDLCRIMNVSRMTVKAWERGFVLPGRENRERLGLIYGMVV